VVPRSRRHLAAVRAVPPPAPRNLERMPESTRWETSLPPDEALAAGRGVLRRRRFRTTGDATTVSAEKGHLSETGNLVFHVAMLGFLVAVALGSFYGFHGRVVVAEGQGFANAVSQYDDFEPGTLFDPSDLEPFVVTLDDFHATFARDGDQRGAPRSFDAQVTYQEGAQGRPQSYDLRVNHPLVVDGTKVFLVNHGYAPRFTVRDGNGDVAWSGPVPFLQQDGNFTSSGVVKAPDARPTQLGLEGLFLPTATVDPERGPRSAFPAPRNPGVFLTAYEGDLGLDSGLPQSVYELDKDGLTQLREDGEPFRVALAPGETRQLPGGVGSVTFDGVSRWAQLDVADDPGSTVALGSAVAALAGLTASLFVRRRRVWVRVAPGASGRTVVEVGGLPRAESHGFTDEFADLGAGLRRAVPEEE
jgi:cytochrome c biogenesis protein